jgi:hypothetical protein
MEAGKPFPAKLLKKDESATKSEWDWKAER